MNVNLLFTTRMHVRVGAAENGVDFRRFIKFREKSDVHSIRRQKFRGTVNSMNDENKPNPFQFLDFSYEEAKEANEHLAKTRLGRDKRICVCGHPFTRHSLNPRGQVICKPSSLYCPCKEQRLVLEAGDVRDFLFKTVGSAKFHALGRGLQRAMEKENSVEWVIEMKCDRCGEEKPLAPVSVTQNVVIRDEPTGWDKLLCKECRQQA